jgi:hypothetical protein
MRSDTQSRQRTLSSLERKTIIARDSFEALRSHSTPSPQKHLSRTSLQHITRKISQNFRAIKVHRLESNTVSSNSEDSSTQRGPGKENRRKSFMSLRSRFSSSDVDKTSNEALAQEAKASQSPRHNTFASLRWSGIHGSRRGNPKETLERRVKSENHTVDMKRIQAPRPQLELPTIEHGRLIDTEEHKLFRNPSLRSVVQTDLGNTQGTTRKPALAPRTDHFRYVSLDKDFSLTPPPSNANHATAPRVPRPKSLPPAFFNGIDRRSPKRKTVQREIDDASSADYHTAQETPTVTPRKSSLIISAPADEQTIKPSAGSKAEWEVLRQNIEDRHLDEEVIEPLMGSKAEWDALREERQQRYKTIQSLSSLTPERSSSSLQLHRCPHNQHDCDLDKHVKGPEFATMRQAGEAIPSTNIEDTVAYTRPHSALFPLVKDYKTGFTSISPTASSVASEGSDHDRVGNDDVEGKLDTNLRCSCRFCANVDGTMNDSGASSLKNEKTSHGQTLRHSGTPSPHELKTAGTRSIEIERYRPESSGTGRPFSRGAYSTETLYLRSRIIRDISGSSAATAVVGHPEE